MSSTGEESSSCRGPVFWKFRYKAKVSNQVLGVCSWLRKEEPSADQERLRDVDRPGKVGQGKQATVEEPLFPHHEPRKEAAGARVVRGIWD